MGNAINKYRRGGSSAKTRTVIVTSQQRLILLRTWEKLSAEMANIGISVMLRIFELRPKYKNSFSFCQKTGNDLIQDKMFRIHAFNFAQAANAVVENIDNLDDEVKPFFFFLGRRHVGRPDFRVANFGILADAMSHAWEEQLKERFSVQTEQAWRSVFTFISGTMTDGYIQEQMDRETALCPDPSLPTVLSTELPPSMRSRARSHLGLRDPANMDRLSPGMLYQTSRSTGAVPAGESTAEQPLPLPLTIQPLSPAITTKVTTGSTLLDVPAPGAAPPATQRAQEEGDNRGRAKSSCTDSAIPSPGTSSSDIPILSLYHH